MKETLAFRSMRSRINLVADHIFNITGGQEVCDFVLHLSDLEKHPEMNWKPTERKHVQARCISGQPSSIILNHLETCHQSQRETKVETVTLIQVRGHESMGNFPRTDLRLFIFEIEIGWQDFMQVKWTKVASSGFCRFWEVGKNYFRFVFIYLEKIICHPNFYFLEAVKKRIS